MASAALLTATVFAADPATVFAGMEQQAATSIAYDSIGLGWHHPDTRSEYREGKHPSHVKSRARQQSSVAAIRADAQQALPLGADALRNAAVAAFVREIGLTPGEGVAAAATFDGVADAVAHELLHPLRALNEGRESMERTFNGWPVPRAEIDVAVDGILRAVLSHSFRTWRYTNPVGKAQLEGLSAQQLELWTSCVPTSAGKLSASEGSESELDFFWAVGRWADTGVS
jgi:hypothetical protein